MTGQRKPKGKPVNIWLPEEFVDFLEEMADEQERSVSNYIGMNLKRYFSTEYQKWQKKKKDEYEK